jgi:organic radical activating enzyme
MNLFEIFSSVQGEGPTVGASTLFVRFGGCDLRCRWCDSPHTWRPAQECRIQVARGSREMRTVPNPVALDLVVQAARDLEAASHRWASLTGGEPLLQPEAVAAAAAALRALGPRIHLETHGLEAEALRAVLPHLDLVSMDWKLASDVRRAEASPESSGAGFDVAHEAFLAVARSAPAVVVKIVVTTASRDEEVEAAARAVARTAPGATLVLQPVTPAGPVRERPCAERLLSLAARAEALLADVRVIPQTHPIYGAP